MINYKGNKYKLKEANFDTKLRVHPYNSIDLCFYIKDEKNHYAYIDNYDAIVFEIMVKDNTFINNTAFNCINDGVIDKSNKIYNCVKNIIFNGSVIDILECIEYMYLYRTDLDYYSQIMIKDLKDENLKNEIKEELKKVILDKFM